MRKLFVKEENKIVVVEEVNYKALYESAMQEVAKLQEELEETRNHYEEKLTDWQDYCADKEIEIAYNHSRIRLYEALLSDVEVALWSNGERANLEDIVTEFGALLENKTTGYEYFEDKDYQEMALYGYELINNNEEETNMENVERILIANNGVKVLIVMADKDGNVIKHIESDIQTTLMYRDISDIDRVDRATIAELCGMTEVEFNINYGTLESKYHKHEGKMMLTYAEYDLNDEETKEIVRNNGGRYL